MYRVFVILLCIYFLRYIGREVVPMSVKYLAWFEVEVGIYSCLLFVALSAYNEVALVAKRNEILKFQT